MFESQWPFVERDRELAEFEHAWSRRRCHAVVVFGEAGVGKSRLAEEFVARAVRHGAREVRVTATATAAAVPLGAIAHLIPPQVDMSRPVSAFAEIARLLAGQKWAVLVDDLHLLDAASTALLRYLMDTGAIRLIATVRTGGAVGDAVEALTPGDAVWRLDVAPFDPEGAERLLRSALGAPVGHRTLHRLFEASGGNALYLRELVHGALTAGTLSGDGEIWELADGALPTTPRLGQLISARLAAAPPAARGVLQLLALCGSVSLTDAVSASSMEVLAGLEEAGLITSRQDGRRALIVLSHPLYGEALRADLSALRRRQLLLDQIARSEAYGCRRHDDALRVASWRLAATGTADPALLVHAAAVARHAHDHEQVVALMRALPAADRDYRTCLLHGDALVQLGRWRAAETMLVEAGRLATTEQDRVAATMVRTWNLFWVAARTEQALQVNAEARDSGLSPPGRRLLTINEASLLTVAGRPAQGLALLDRLEADVRDAPDASSWLMGAMSRTAGLAYLGRTSEAIPWGQAAYAAHMAFHERTLGPAHPTSQLIPLIFALTDAGRLAEAAATAEKVLTALVDTEAAQTHMWAAVYRGRVAWLSGDMHLARRWYAEAVTQGEAHHQVRPLGQAWAGLAAAAAVLGDVAAAETALERMRAYPAMGHQAGEERLGEAWLYAVRGHLSQAREVLLAAASAARDTGQVTSEMLLLTDVARLGGAALVATRLVELSGHCDGAFAHARAALATAVTADDPEALTAVAGELESLGAYLLAAEAAAAAAGAWRRQGRARRATAAGQLMRGLAARCPGASTPMLAAAEATYALTDRQREIVLLAAANTQSKEIAEALHLSVRTVDNHLQRAYAKLGISRRGELATVLGGRPE